ncbi:accessory factor UbiK family protein [Emcibacter sp.]|uniref:accessory factor UbiK family protein n=1 Tax=Emcibacter sp. TaxID=1979954 RepID=UPI003A8DD184
MNRQETDPVQTDNKFFDDLARLGQSAAGTLHGMKQEVENLVRQRLETVLMDMELVTREEFEVVRELAAEARRQNEELAGKVGELEAKIAKLEKKK